MGEGKGHHKHHSESGHIKEGNLLLATVMNLIITIVEIAGGIVSNSLALLSDALHNLSDTFATFIAYMASRISKRSPDDKNTFGYKRVEILAAMLNAVILIVICVFLFKEAYERILNPEPLKALVVIIVAMIGLGANLLAVSLLRSDSKKNINVRAAYVHLIGDSLSSVVVILSALAIQLFELYWIDPIITILIGLYLIRETYVILKEAVGILMQATPENVDLRRIQRKIEAFDEVESLHHIHSWSLNDNELHLEAHVQVTRDFNISELDVLREEIESLMLDRYHIQHTTLQFEYNTEHSKSLISKNH